MLHSYWLKNWGPDFGVRSYTYRYGFSHFAQWGPRLEIRWAAKHLPRTQVRGNTTVSADLRTVGLPRPSFIILADPAPLRLAPQACGVAGQADWMPSAHALGLGDVRPKLTRPIAPPKLAFIVALGFDRFVSESRPFSRWYPLTGTMSLIGCYREPLSGCRLGSFFLPFYSNRVYTIVVNTIHLPSNCGG